VSYTELHFTAAALVSRCGSVATRRPCPLLWPLSPGAVPDNPKLLEPLSILVSHANSALDDFVFNPFSFKQSAERFDMAIATNEESITLISD
jgi:hypothetical protein